MTWLEALGALYNVVALRGSMALATGIAVKLPIDSYWELDRSSRGSRGHYAIDSGRAGHRGTLSSFQ